MRYFAYGCNMDPVHMARLCPDARPVCAARLAGHRLTFTWDSPGWGGGVAHVEPAQGEEVWGVLWEIGADDQRALDEYEGVPAGAYVRDVVTVETPGGDARALVYRAVPRGYKPPSRRYMNALVRGARRHGLPDAYVERLRALAP